jgi:hypothetical protein
MDKIDWVNPMGYAHNTPDHDDANHPCKDLNHFMSWVFWRSGVVSDRGGNHEDLRAVRQLMLNGLKHKTLATTLYKINNADIYVAAASDGDLFSLFLDIADGADETHDLHFVYYLDLSVWVEKYVDEAIKLNQDLVENPPVVETTRRRPRPDWGRTMQPAGEEIVIASQATTNTPAEPVTITHTRIVPEGSEAFRDCQRYIQEAHEKRDMQIVRALFKDGGAATYLQGNEFVRIMMLAAHACSQIWSKWSERK